MVVRTVLFYLSSGFMIDIIIPKVAMLEVSLCFILDFNFIHIEKNKPNLIFGKFQIKLIVQIKQIFKQILFELLEFYRNNKMIKHTIRGAKSISTQEIFINVVYKDIYIIFLTFYGVQLCISVNLTTLFAHILHENASIYYVYPYINKYIKVQYKMISNQDDDHDYFQRVQDQFMVYTYNNDNYPIHNYPKIQKPLTLKSISQKHKLQFLSGKFHNSRSSKTRAQNKRQQRGRIIHIGQATFKSNFQCGNINMVENIAHNTYLILLENQVNSWRMSIWFYFSIQGLEGDIKFIIQGFTKTSSLYNEGMKICYRDKNSNDNLWKRGGKDISYNRSLNEDLQEKSTYELNFTFNFESKKKTYQFAYCFPYSYSRLNKFIFSHQHDKLLTIQTLTKTCQGRSLPIITIGNADSQYVIFLSARVHPGQTVGSFMMEGLLRQLLSSSNYAIALRKNFLFKIVPMLNPDGVIRGNYRFSFAGCDLNRKWSTCKPKKHPQIYFWKQYMKKIKLTKKVLMYIDMHGHSRKRNVFFYGCASNKNDCGPKQFPYLMQKIYSQYFKYNLCSFVVQQDKAGTARIAMWKQLKIKDVFTVQSTFCGGTDNKNYMEEDYLNIGKKLCEGIAAYFSNKFTKLQSIDSKILENMTKVRKFVVDQLGTSPELQQIGMIDDSGSESQPDIGQNTNENFLIQQKYSPKKIGRRHEQFIKKMEPFATSANANKLKGQNGRLKTNKYQSEKFQAATKSFSYGTRDIKTAKNRSQSTNNNINSTIYYLKMMQNLEQEIPQGFSLSRNKTNAQENFNISIFRDRQENYQKKEEESKADLLRRKLMLQRQGAQYRRIKKFAQQNNKRTSVSVINEKQYITENPVIKGLVGVNNELDIQKIRKNLKKSTMFGFYPKSSNQKYRKNSYQSSLRKHNKLQAGQRRIYVNGIDLQVKCRGNRIPYKT